MKRFLKAFGPPSIIAIPVIFFAVMVAIVPTKPDVPGWLSPQERDWAIADYAIKSRQVAGAWATIAIVVTVAAMVFFLPTAVAGLRNAPSYLGIVVVNVVGGPFLIGWIAALIWAFVDRRPESVVIQNIYQFPPPPNPNQHGQPS